MPARLEIAYGVIILSIKRQLASGLFSHPFNPSAVGMTGSKWMPFWIVSFSVPVFDL